MQVRTEKAMEDTYYRDHWVEIEPERLESYEALFAWRPQLAPLIEPAELGPGLTVLDYGCGPGGLTVELARRVGAGGEVIGADLNAAMLERARARAAREIPEVPTRFVQVTDDRLPLPGASVDRVLCKNVLEYVTDIPALLAELRRVLRPGGLLHVVDSDWGLLVVEPIEPERLSRLFDAARIAYRTPLVGRKAYGLMRAAGFDPVKVRVQTPADTKGYLAPIVENMASYARASGRVPESFVAAIEEEVRSAIEARTYLLVLPQFLVTGTRS